MGKVREGNEARRWGRCQSGEVGRWEVLGFVQGWGIQGESKILSFLSDVGNGNNEQAGFKIFLRSQRAGKTLLRSFASC